MTIQEMKEKKREKGYTYALMSELSGVPLGTIQKIFSGETVSPRYDTLKALEELFREADFVSLHLPETAETRGMINKDLLSLMKPTASLINCARGGIVNEDDLYEALSTHRIHGAGVDVLTREPYCPDDRLLKLDNLIVTPHNAALNTETMNKMGLDAARGIDEVLSGQSPSWPVNKF